MGNTPTKFSCTNVDTIIKPSSPPMEKTNNDDPINCEDPANINKTSKVIKVSNKTTDKKTADSKITTNQTNDNFKTTLLLKNLENLDFGGKLDNSNLIQGEEPAIIDRRHITLIIKHTNVKNSHMLKIANNIEFLYGAKNIVNYHMTENQHKFIIFGLEQRKLNLEEKKILAELINTASCCQQKNDLMKYI